MWNLYFLVFKLFNYILPYSDKRKQLLKMTFLINEQNASDMYIDINYHYVLDFNIFQQDEFFCSKLGMEVEQYANSNIKTSLSQIWEIFDWLPFVRVGQY